MTLTKRQRKILEFLKDFTERNGYAPSLTEIGAHFGLRSAATVHKHLRNLEAKGVLRRKWNHSRAIELLPEEGTSRAFELPLVGLLSAQREIQLHPAERTVPVPHGLVARSRTFVLRVDGEGFNPELLRGGDLVIVEETSTPPEGSVVIAHRRGHPGPEIRIHRRREDVIFLDPLPGTTGVSATVAPEDVQLHGRLVDVLRQY